LDLSRKLDYDVVPNIKLDFEPKSSSMKKKIQKISTEEKEKFKGINLFEVLTREDR
jgi:hypothetical protein